MPSKSFNTFRQNQDDVRRLLRIHQNIAGEDPGRKYGVEVLNKSAIVLTCAYWEAYVEDVVSEALDFIISHTTEPDKLPVELRKFVAATIKKAPHDLSPWKLAGAGWQAEVRTNLFAAKSKQLGNWNTPKAQNVNELCNQALGMPCLTSAWKWQACNSAKAQTKLDAFVALRGAIAHRGKSAESVTKWDVTEALGLVDNLANKTDGAINGFVSANVGISFF